MDAPLQFPKWLVSINCLPKNDKIIPTLVDFCHKQEATYIPQVSESSSLIDKWRRVFKNVPHMAECQYLVAAEVPALIYALVFGCYFSSVKTAK